MLIHIYEEIVNEDGTTSQGKLVGEIKCIGDGTPGEFIFHDTCNDLWQVKDKKDHRYGMVTPILTDLEKRLLKREFNDFRPIFTGGGLKNGVHHTEGKLLHPWEKDAIKYALEYGVRVHFGTIMTKIIEE